MENLSMIQSRVSSDWRRATSAVKVPLRQRVEVNIPSGLIDGGKFEFKPGFLASLGMTIFVAGLEAKSGRPRKAVLETGPAGEVFWRAMRIMRSRGVKP